MRLFMLAVVATLSLPASGAAQQSPAEIAAAAQTEIIRSAPPNAEFAPSRAVDHVAVMSVNPNSHRPSDIHRAIVARSGDWMRTDRGIDGRSVGYSNFATGVSIEIVRDEAGQVRELSASRHRAGDTVHVYARVRTGERDSHLGETCDIWRMTAQREPSPVWLTCVTYDGVELWSRTLYSNGEIMASAQAISVERRPVRAEEVRPPAEAFNWETWRASAPRTRRAPNDEVRLALGRERRVIRRRDGWTYRGQPARYGSLRHEGAGIELSYLIGEDSRPLELSIERIPGDPRPPNPGVSLERTDFVVGERCAWFDMMPETEDAGLSECRTRDGAILVVSEFTWATGRRFTATSIRRNVVSAADMRPPLAAFAWLR